MKRFSHLAVVPLAVPQPPVDVEALREFAHTYCEQCAFRGNQIRYVMLHARKPIHRGRMVLQPVDPAFDHIGPRTRFDWDPTFAARFPRLCTWSERLPFRTLGNVCVVTQTADIREHVDITGNETSRDYYETFKDVEPRFYRVIVGTSLPARSRSFYVTTKYGGPKQYIRLPRTTSTIALGSSTCYHGADFQEGHYKSTLVFYGELDTERHLALVQKSVRRYPRYVIRTGADGPVDGPAMESPYRGAE